MKIQIYCQYDKLMNPKNLKDHPKNRNGHGSDQIERLAKLYEYHGVRYDCGSKLGYLKASVEFALRHPEVSKDFEVYLKARSLL